MPVCQQHCTAAASPVLLMCLRFMLAQIQGWGFEIDCLRVSYGSGKGFGCNLHYQYNSTHQWHYRNVV